MEQGGPSREGHGRRVGAEAAGQPGHPLAQREGDPDRLPFENGRASVDARMIREQIRAREAVRLVGHGVVGRDRHGGNAGRQNGITFTSNTRCTIQPIATALIRAEPRRSFTGW